MMMKQRASGVRRPRNGWTPQRVKLRPKLRPLRVATLKRLVDGPGDRKEGGVGSKSTTTTTLRCVLCVAERRLRRAPASSHVTRCACHVGRRFGWPHSAPSSGHGRTSSSHKTFEFCFFFGILFLAFFGKRAKSIEMMNSRSRCTSTHVGWSLHTATPPAGQNDALALRRRPS